MLESDLFNLLRGTADAAFVVDSQGLTKSWNTAAEKLWATPRLKFWTSPVLS